MLEADGSASSVVVGGANAAWTEVRPLGNNSNGFEDFYLEPKARIWPCLSCMCHIRSTAVGKWSWGWTEVRVVGYPPALERRENNLIGFQHFYLNAKARTWP